MNDDPITAGRAMKDESHKTPIVERYAERHRLLNAWIRGPITESTEMPPQEGLLSELILIEELSRAEKRVATLQTALESIRFGVKLMVPEPQQSGFLRVIATVLAPAPEQQEKQW